MPIYKAPLKDIDFLLKDFLCIADWLPQIKRFADFTLDDIDAVLEEGAKMAEALLLPTNQIGDSQGCQLENGKVVVPKCFKDAYQSYNKGGWIGLIGEPAYGGQGLPSVVGRAVGEMQVSANSAWSMLIGLNAAAADALFAHGSEALKSSMLPKLYDGTWSGTMCLTEAHCGTDLGLLKTKAQLQADGSYKITGSKIFISWGDHEITDNIVHLVLARVSGAPQGTKGISLFTVAKHKIDAAGQALNEPNGVSCGGLEEKMGIHASPTCIINFDQSSGQMVGELNHGMSYMFTMMNTARLATGLQGLSIAEVSYQNAAAYAKERLQGRHLAGAKHEDKAADPIIVHPDVRRMLMTMRAYNEGGRAFALWLAMQLDTAKYHTDSAVKQDAQDMISLLTPVAKAFLTDNSFECCNLGMQVLGGHGYIREWGMEQFSRDARITQIYEGTNGVQALDLLGRKVLLNQGEMLRKFTKKIHKFVKANESNHEMQVFTAPLVSALLEFGELSMWVGMQALENREVVGAAATAYLRYLGLLSFAYMWASMAKIAFAKLQHLQHLQHLQQKSATQDSTFYQSKITTATFFFEHLFSQTSYLAVSIKSGATSLMSLPEEAF